MLRTLVVDGDLTREILWRAAVRAPSSRGTSPAAADDRPVADALEQLDLALRVPRRAMNFQAPALAGVARFG